MRYRGPFRKQHHTNMRDAIMRSRGPVSSFDCNLTKTSGFQTTVSTLFIVLVAINQHDVRRNSLTAHPPVYIRWFTPILRAPCTSLLLFDCMRPMAARSPHDARSPETFDGVRRQFSAKTSLRRQAKFTHLTVISQCTLLQMLNMFSEYASSFQYARQLDV